MTKTFIQSDELGENWFEALNTEYSYLWLVLKLNCNKGGIIALNPTKLSYLAKFEVDINNLKKYFEDQITIFRDKLFINNYFADQNGYELNLTNDAIRGRLKSFFEHEELTEDLLRNLGYKFFIRNKDKSNQIYNVKEFLNRYQRIPQDHDSIDPIFFKNNIQNDNNKRIGSPIGSPRSSSSNSSSIGNGNNNDKEIRINQVLSLEAYKEQLINYPKIKSIKNQLDQGELNLLFEIDSPRKITNKVFWDAVNDLEKNNHPIIQDSVYKSLEGILSLPF